MRVGAFSEGRVALEAGQRFRLDMRDAPGDAARVSLRHEEIYAALQPGVETPFVEPLAREPSSGEPPAEEAPADEPAPGERLNLLGHVEALERDLIQRTLTEVGGNQSEAARRLGVSRGALLGRLKKYGSNRSITG